MNCEAILIIQAQHDRKCGKNHEERKELEPLHRIHTAQHGLALSNLGKGN